MYVELFDLDSCAIPLVSEQQHTSIDELLWFSSPHNVFVSLGKEHRSQRSEICDWVFRGGAVGNGFWVFDGTLKERIRDDFVFSAIHRGRRSCEESRVTPGTFKLFLELSCMLEFGLEPCGRFSEQSFSSDSSFSGRSPSFGMTLSFRLYFRSLVGLVVVGDVLASLF